MNLISHGAEAVETSVVELLQQPVTPDMRG